LEVLHQAPTLYGHESSRWTLERLRASCAWLKGSAETTLSRLLNRLGIRYKRGRIHLHSPDLTYQAKVAQLAQYQARQTADPDRYPLLYLDEVTFYRQPTLARAYAACGEAQSAAPLSHRSNTKARIVGALDGATGQVHYCQRSKIGTRILRDFWYQLRAAYPHAEEIAVVLDNWPVHFHPEVLAVLQPQGLPFTVLRPPNWPTEASPKVARDALPIQLLQLPTYAPWLNPIEKLWRYLYQEVLHLHRDADDWLQLKQRVCSFLDRFALPSPQLLSYVGLLRI
jgi:hypothetical protein